MNQNIPTKVGCNSSASETRLNTNDRYTAGNATNCVSALWCCCLFYPRPETTIGPYYADRWIGSNGSVPWAPNLFPTVSYLLGHLTSILQWTRVNRRGSLVHVIEEVMAQIPYELELVNLQDLLSFAGRIFALK